MKPIKLLQRAQASVKHQMRTRSIQGTNTIFNQNKTKVSKDEKMVQMQTTNKPLKFAKISKLQIQEVSCT
jgi:hypothetical protein